VNGQAVDAQVVSIDASATKPVTFRHVFDSAGGYTVAVGSQTATAAISEQPIEVWVLALAGGLLVAGLAIGAVVGRMMSRRGKRPPAMGMEKEETKPADEELPPEENL